MEPIAIMLRKADPAFKGAVDESIVAMMQSGEIGRLYERWFMQPIPPSNTASVCRPATPRGRPGRSRTTRRSRPTRGSEGPLRRGAGPCGRPARECVLIEIRNVSKWYGSFQVLADCSTSVARGEVVVVCGPSGSGKSTLIKTVNALEPFQQGDIVVDGISLSDPKTDLPKLRARVGMVFQHFELFPHLSVTENLTLAQVRVLGRSRDDALARGLKMLDRVGLMAHKDKFPGQLSGGQQQRVAIARALSMDPIVMLFDEPDLGARSRDGGRGARRHGAARQRGHDDDVRDARDGLRKEGQPPRRLHGPGPHRRGLPEADFFGNPEARSPRAREFLSKILASTEYPRGAMGQSSPCPRR